MRQLEITGPACYILSACRPEHTPATNEQRTERLRLGIQASGFPYRNAVCYWEGNREASFVVFVPAGRGKEVRAKVLAWAKRYSQDSVMYVNPRRRCYLISGPGFSQERIGQLEGQAAEPQHVPGWTYVPALSTYFVARGTK